MNDFKVFELSYDTHHCFYGRLNGLMKRWNYTIFKNETHVDCWDELDDFTLKVGGSNHFCFLAPFHSRNTPWGERLLQRFGEKVLFFDPRENTKETVRDLNFKLYI